MATTNNGQSITHAVVRMYCMGTGDCFIVKFFSGEEEKFTMMIDGGVWKGSTAKLEPYINNLKEYVKAKIDLLVITHEHVDHVSVFEHCRDLFTKDFEIKRIWMGWTEDDSLAMVKKWKTAYGEKKKALALSAEKIAPLLAAPHIEKQILLGANGDGILDAKRDFAASLKNFSDLHLQAAEGGAYKGLLEGMRIVKEVISNNNIEYFTPGEIIDDIPGLEGIRFYVLGPPESMDVFKKEAGPSDESYRHNNQLKGTDAFAAAILQNTSDSSAIAPFDRQYEANGDTNTRKTYNDEEACWRTIEADWLFSAGALALRVSSLTNNLSLALAIEFKDSKRVMLFPGDAEYESWKSWHNIAWQGVDNEPGKHFTETLLNRTVFYKVAHHMSHNGTARRLGLEMMNHKDLSAMVTLDYNVIAPKWKNTMPNEMIVRELLKKTRGRVMVMNEEAIMLADNTPLTENIAAARKKMNPKELDAFKASFLSHPEGYCIDYTVNGF